MIVLGIMTAVVSASPQAPSVTEVLLKEGNSANWPLLTVGFFALTLATLSFAKGYEMLKRKRVVENDLLRSGQIQILKEENARLISSAQRMREDMEAERRRQGQLAAQLKEKHQNEEVLLRSANQIKKEYEKTLADKEKLAQEMNKLSSKAALTPLKLKIVEVKKAKPAKIKAKKEVVKRAPKARKARSKRGKK